MTSGSLGDFNVRWVLLPSLSDFGRVRMEQRFRLLSAVGNKLVVKAKEVVH